MIERKLFIYLKSVFEHLILKLNYLAVIYASQKEINSEKRFRYYKISIYQLRSFDVFLQMLKLGKIEICLESRLARSGLYVGKYKNKGLIFKIKKELLEEFFVKIYHEDCDEKIRFYDYVNFFEMK